MIVIFDPNLSGISGNMIVGALIDLYKEGKSDVNKLGEKLNLEVKINRVKKHGFFSTYVETSGEERLSIKEMKAKIKNLNLGGEEKRFSLKVLHTILEGEKRLHGSAHLHELGSSDTGFDICATALLARKLGFFKKDTKIFSTPIRVGTGRIKSEHGEIFNPSPIVMDIATQHRIPLEFSDIPQEIATPTGVALLANLVGSFRPSISVAGISKIGYGAGSFSLPFPNLLRVMLCYGWSKNEHISIVETNLDDVSGEIIGHLIERLVDLGALDIQVLQGITKKNRPSYVVQVTCKTGEEEKFANLLMKETGSLGVKVRRGVERITLKREVVKKTLNLWGHVKEVRIKVSYDSNGEITNYKPEFEDIKKISRELNLPVKKVYNKVMKEISL